MFFEIKLGAWISGQLGQAQTIFETRTTWTAHVIVEGKYTLRYPTRVSKCEATRRKSMEHFIIDVLGLLIALGNLLLSVWKERKPPKK